MIPHTDEEHYLEFEEIYRIFESIDFPYDNEVLEMYENILKIRIHRVDAMPQLFPYNKVA
jgi:hypothetical protein